MSVFDGGLDGWDDPDPDRRPVRELYTAADAERELGIPAGTVRSWANRGQLQPFGLDDRDRPMYDGTDLARLRDVPRGHPTRRLPGELTDP